MSTAFGDRLALNGLIEKLHARGVPLEVVSDIAGACYPAGAEREREKSGRSFAKPLFDPSEASRVVADLLQMSSSEVNANLIAQLDALFGQNYAEAWLKQRPEQQSQPDASPVHAHSTSTAFGDRLALRGLRRKLVDRGIPLEIATQLAGACYPAGAERERERSGRGFTRSLVEPREACGVVAELLQTPSSEVKATLVRRLEILYGQDYAREWIAELPPQRTPKTVEQPTDLPKWFFAVLFLAGLFLIVALFLFGPKGEPPIEQTAVGVVEPTPPPPPPPRPVASPLVKVSQSANHATVPKQFRDAIRELTPLHEKYPSEDVTDIRLWAGCLQGLQSRGKEYWDRSPKHSETDEFHHWQAMHDIGLAWHRLMKDAIALKQSALAQRAFENADLQYKEVIRSVRLVTPPQSVSEWRVMLGEFAMENFGELCGQMSAYTGDEKMSTRARTLMESTKRKYAELYGTDSEQYRRVGRKLTGLVSQGDSD